MRPIHYQTKRQPDQTMTSQTTNDHGADPIGGGKFRMIPSGDIVDREERDRRLPPRSMDPINGVFGRTWEEIERMQGGRLQR